jgi:hypothetical protein
MTTVEVLDTLMALALIKDKAGLIDLLRRNGIDISYAASDEEVVLVALNASAASDYIKSDLTNYLTNLAVTSQDELSYLKFTGEDDEDFFNSTGFGTGTAAFLQKSGVSNVIPSAPTTVRTPTPTTTAPSGTATKQKTGAGKAISWLGTNVFNPQNITTAIGGALNIFGNRQQTKATEAQIRLEETRNRQIEIAQGLPVSQGGGGIFNPAGQGGGNKTLTYVLVGVGVLVIGVSMFFILRKK